MSALHANEVHLTAGLGLNRPQGWVLNVLDWSAPSVAQALAKLKGGEAWWSPHAFFKNYRTANQWLAVLALVADLDWCDREAPRPEGKDPAAIMPPHGWHVAMPAEARARLLDAMKAGRLSGSLGHGTPRGGRAVALLADPCRDADAFDAAIAGFGQRLMEELAAIGLAHDGTRGLTFDEAATDLARLLFAPNATVDGHIRSAEVVVFRDDFFAVEDFTPAPEEGGGIIVPAEPVVQGQTPLPPVPWSALPGSLGEYGRAVAANMEVPEPLVFGSMLATASAVVPATARIIGRPGHFEIAPIWVAEIAYPGSKKTPAINRIVEPLNEHDARLQVAFQQATELHQAKCAELLAVKRKRSLSKAEQPPEPERAHVLIDDFTPEALADVLAANHRHALGVLLAPDELMALFGSFNQYKRAGTDRQRILKLWAGQPIRVIRRGRFIYSPSPRAALIAGIQPEVARRLQALDESDGLLERLHWLDCRMERAPLYDVPPVHDALAAEWRARVMALLPDLSAQDLTPDPAATISDAELDARTYRLNDDARDVFRPFYESCDRRGLRGWERGYMGKVAGQCLRCALTLHHLQHGREVFHLLEVDGDAAQNAVTITQFLAAHTMRVRSELCESRSYSPEVEAAVRWLRAQGGRGLLRDLYRNNVAGVQTAEAAEALAMELIRAGLAVWGTQTSTAGRDRRELILTEGGAA